MPPADIASHIRRVGAAMHRDRHHHDGRRSVHSLVSLPPTGTPRGVARQVAGLFASGASIALMVCALPETGGVQRSVAAGVALLAAAVTVVVLRRPRMGRASLHVALVVAAGCTGLMVLTTTDPALSTAFSSAFIVVALVAMTTSSWAAASCHAAGALACLGLQPVVQPDSSWGPTLVTGCVLVMICAFAGLLVRSAAAAEFDGLTGLVNRRGGQRHLDGAVAGRGPLSVALVDLDHFKAVNDSRGHAAGDALLRSLADALHCATTQLGPGRKVLVSRWGGDEFLVAAPVQAARLLAAVDRARDLMGTPGTFSAGVAEVAPGETWGFALHRADVALYQVKESTRGRSAVAVAREHQHQQLAL